MIIDPSPSRQNTWNISRMLAFYSTVEYNTTMMDVCQKYVFLNSGLYMEIYVAADVKAQIKDN
jgi:hypothetical protein